MDQPHEKNTTRNKTIRSKIEDEDKDISHSQRSHKMQALTFSRALLIAFLSIVVLFLLNTSTGIHTFPSTPTNITSTSNSTSSSPETRTTSPARQMASSLTAIANPISYTPAATTIVEWSEPENATYNTLADPHSWSIALLTGSIWLFLWVLLFINSRVNFGALVMQMRVRARPTAESAVEMRQEDPRVAERESGEWMTESADERGVVDRVGEMGRRMGEGLGVVEQRGVGGIRRRGMERLDD